MLFECAETLLFKTSVTLSLNLNEKEIKSLAIKNYQSIAITFLEIFNLK